MITLEIPAGDNIYTAAARAQAMARLEREDVCFDFNRIHLRVTPYSHPDDIAEIYHLRHRLRQLAPNES